MHARRVQSQYSIQALDPVNLRGLLNPRDVEDLLRKVREGVVSPAEAAERLKSLPYEDLGFAKVDHHRALRRGFPEVVYGGGKSPEQIRSEERRVGKECRL